MFCKWLTCSVCSGNTKTSVRLFLVLELIYDISLVSSVMVDADASNFAVDCCFMLEGNVYQLYYFIGTCLLLVGVVGFIDLMFLVFAWQTR